MKKIMLRIQHRMCFWVLQKKCLFWGFIPYWKDIYDSPFLEDIEAEVQRLKKQGNELGTR